MPLYARASTLLKVAEGMRGGRLFFQAEDGIRDYKVTGVQTCALPISERRKVSWTKEAPADQRGRRLASRRKGAHDNSWKAITPPGRTSCDKERKTATGSGRNIKMKRPTTASKGLLLGIWETSDWVKVTLCRPASDTRALALAMERASRSTPTTSPEGLTSLATSMATSPTPEPISSTRWPGPMPAARKNRSVKGARSAACLMRRSCSASVLPRA